MPDSDNHSRRPLAQIHQQEDAEKLGACYFFHVLEKMDSVTMASFV